MGHQFSPEVERLVQQHMATGKYATEDELLVEALHTLAVERRELAAVQEGIDSLERGEQGLSLDEAFEAVRRKHNVSSQE